MSLKTFAPAPSTETPKLVRNLRTSPAASRPAGSAADFAASRRRREVFVWFDRLGVGLSGLCVVHCLLTPFALLLLPALESSAVHEGFHRTLLYILPLLALFAFIPGYRRHRRWAVFAFGVPGLMLIALGALVFEHQIWLEAGSSIAGSLCLITAHFMNRRWLAAAGFKHHHVHGESCGDGCGGHSRLSAPSKSTLR